MIKISSHSVMYFFLLLMVCGISASMLSGEKIVMPALAQFTLFCSMIGCFFAGAAGMAEKNREQLKNILIKKGGAVVEENSEVSN